MNVISYSLYGNNPRFWKCLVANMDIVPEIYPDWNVWIYASGVDSRILNLLENKGAKIIHMESKPGHIGMFWRFRPFWHPEVTRTIVRDADDLLSYTDKHAVDLWKESGCLLYTLHASCGHKTPIVGSLFGITSDWAKHKLPIPEHGLSSEYGADEYWLASKLLPLVRHSWLRLRVQGNGVKDEPGMVTIKYIPTPKNSVLRTPGLLKLASFGAYLIRDVQGQRSQSRDTGKKYNPSDTSDIDEFFK